MIIFRNKNYKYEDCKERIDNVLMQLQKNGVNRVGIRCKRTPELVYLLKELYDYGITFVPIDINCPVDRCNYIVSKSDIKWIVTEKDISRKFEGVQNIYIDSLLGESLTVDNYVKKYTNPAYILFTSGSTGKPKGVEISREALDQFFYSIGKSIDFTKGNKIACLTTIMFDIFILESIFALKIGLTIILADETEQSNPRAISYLLKDNNVDIIQITPSRLQMLINYDEKLSCLSSAKVIMVGGEVFPDSLLEKIKKYTNSEIYNMYGPTEATIWCSVSNLTHKNKVDIGKPLVDVEMFILDKNMNQVNTGEIGEICIAGKTLANGYVGEYELTNKQFVYLGDESKLRIYKTGDIGCILRDGSFKCLGRFDNQVKVHGYRIELEEIENCVNGFVGINRSIAYYNSDTSDEIELYFTSDKYVSVNELIVYLSNQLPQYMIPSVYYQVEDFLCTSNGKVDRKRIKECKLLSKYPSYEIKEDKKIGEEIHREVKEFIAEYLNGQIDGGVEMESSLDSMRIDSLTFIKLFVALEDRFGFTFDDEKLIATAFPSIYDLGDYIKMKTQLET